MAPKKAGKKGGGGKASKSKSNVVEAGPIKKDKKSSSSFLVSALPGLILAIAAALYFRLGDGNNAGTNTTDVGKDASSSSSSSSSSGSTHNLITPNPGSWADGYYTTQSISDQSAPSTHALIYPNGGFGEPQMMSFSNNEEFLALGRLYNDLGQIVQSRDHFRNGTALYAGPDKAGTHFQWPAGK